MKKGTRIEVYKKYDGHCAYCGKEITYKQMQVDHIFPKDKKHWLKSESMKDLYNIKINDIDDIDNLNPACHRCNNYKRSELLEVFRNEISKQVDRARKMSFNFRCAEDFGLIEMTNKPVIFYFELFNAVNDGRQPRKNIQ